MSQNFSTHSIAPSVCDDDLPRRNVDDARGEALLKLGVKFGWDGGENRDCWEQPVRCGGYTHPVEEVSVWTGQRDQVLTDWRPLGVFFPYSLVAMQLSNDRLPMTVSMWVENTDQLRERTCPPRIFAIKIPPTAA